MNAEHRRLRLLVQLTTYDESRAGSFFCNTRWPGRQAAPRGLPPRTHSIEPSCLPAAGKARYANPFEQQLGARVYRLSGWLDRFAQGRGDRIIH